MNLSSKKQKNDTCSNMKEKTLGLQRCLFPIYTFVLNQEFQKNRLCKSQIALDWLCWNNTDPIIYFEWLMSSSSSYYVLWRKDVFITNLQLQKTDINEEMINKGYFMIFLHFRSWKCVIDMLL